LKIRQEQWDMRPEWDGEMFLHLPEWNTADRPLMHHHTEWRILVRY